MYKAEFRKLRLGLTTKGAFTFVNSPNCMPFPPFFSFENRIFSWKNAKTAEQYFVFSSFSNKKPEAIFEFWLKIWEFLAISTFFAKKVDLCFAVSWRDQCCHSKPTRNCGKKAMAVFHQLRYVAFRIHWNSLRILARPFL